MSKWNALRGNATGDIPCRALDIHYKGLDERFLIFSSNKPRGITFLIYETCDFR